MLLGLFFHHLVEVDWSKSYKVSYILNSFQDLSDNHQEKSFLKFLKGRNVQPSFGWTLR